MADDDAGAVPAPDRIGVAGTPDIGSRRLAEALAARDVDAVGRALRHDIVVVPVVADPEGTLRNRVIPVAGSPRGRLAVFSSTATLSAFLEDDDRRRFVLASGDALRDFLLAWHELLTSVVFDPAGPWPVTASVDDVIGALVPRPDDDEVAWAISGGATPAPGGGRDAVPDAAAGATADGNAPHDPAEAAGAADAAGDADAAGGADAASSVVTALAISLHRDWSPVALEDPATRDAQVEAWAARRLPHGDGERQPRGVFERWLRETADRAGARGRFLALLLRRGKRYPVAFGLTMYWFELGAADVPGHLRRVTDRLRPTLADGDTLATATAPAGAFTRHAWTLPDPGREPLAVVDYWFAFPDGRGLCLLTFCTPQHERRVALQAAAVEVALSARWVYRPART